METINNTKNIVESNNFTFYSFNKTSKTRLNILVTHLFSLYFCYNQ